ncbi:MAG: cupredoxin domain-containing protein [Gemmatimonadota bacterium]|jgi:plastocyanin|nr:cupredoxin domain-containing protein [Gemmatimonadota bacterium]
MRLKLPLFTVLLLPLVAGCGDNSPGAGAAGNTDPSISEVAARGTLGPGTANSGTPLVTATSHPLLPVPQPTGANEVGVRFREYRIEMSDSSVAAGDVTFHVLNSGRTGHTFVVRRAETGEFFATQQISPGDSTLLKTTLKPGIYDFVCMVRDEFDHYSEGERGKLLVE